MDQIKQCANFAFDKATNGQTDIKHEMWQNDDGMVHGRRDEQKIAVRLQQILKQR